MSKLSEKVALITGGGTGIGKEIALTFVKEGAKVVICGRRIAELEAAAEEINAVAADSCTIHQCDIGVEQDVVDMFVAVEEKFAKCDILVNNASVTGQIAPIDELTVEEWEQALRINVTGLMVSCREAVKLMKKNGGGNIVNVSSNVGRRGFRNRNPYVASKWAMHGMSQSIALEGAPFNIRSNTFCPGPVMTERLEGSIVKQAKARGLTEAEIVAEWEAESPMKRFATKEECAKVALFLASDDSSGMTGQALNVTAGVLMT